jgi:sirohydrochlorin cobaltochelatase
MKSMKLAPVLALCLALTAFFPGSAAFGAEAPKEAVLIVAFGTSVEKARVSYAKVEEGVKAAFPGREIRWAWTANSLLKTGAKGVPVLSTQEALAKLATEGVKDVSILSLHIIPGAEYSDLAKNAAAFEGLPKGLERVSLSPPLLSDTESVAVVAKTLLKSVPKTGKDEGVLFVGHGTHHPAGVYYPALQYYLRELNKNAFVGTVEGDLDLEKITATLKAAGIKKVWLAPLMTVAGDHATNDLFGAEPDSWKQRLGASGIAVEAIPRGLGENPDLVALWIDGLRKSAGEKTH